MFSIYFDDSGTAPEQRMAIASAFIIPAAQLLALESEWRTLQTKQGFSIFHASPIAFKNKKEGYPDWSDIKRERVFARVRQISKKYSIAPQGAASFAVHKQEYDDLVPDILKVKVGKDHYTFAIQEVLKMLDAWTKKRNVEYIFDWIKPSDPKRKEIEAVFEARGIKTFSFRSKDDIPGLQCADQIAWTCYQHALLEFFQKTPHPLAVLALNDYGHRLDEHDWLHAVTIRKPELRQFAAYELAKLT